MKSYFLERLSDEYLARNQLSSLLPAQADPWLLLSGEGDPIAYFNLVTDDAGVWCIQADVSGRHYEKDDAVLSIFRRLQQGIGGVIRDDDDNRLE